MAEPPPKPPRTKRRAAHHTDSSCTTPLQSSGNVVDPVENSFKTNENLEQFPSPDGVPSDTIPVKEKAIVAVEENAEYPVVEDQNNLEFQVREDTHLQNMTIDNTPRPISGENTIVDDDLENFSAVEPAVLASSTNSTSGIPSTTSHDGDHCPGVVVEKVNPCDETLPSSPHTPHSKAACLMQNLDHMDSPRSSEASADSVFVEEDVQGSNEPSFQCPGAITCESTQRQSVSSSSSTKGYATPRTSCPESDHSVFIPHSASDTRSSVTATPPNFEQEKEPKDKEVKSKSLRIKDDSSWIGRTHNWPRSHPQTPPRPYSDSASRPLSLEGKLPTTTAASVSTEDFQGADNSQSSSHGPWEDGGNETDIGHPMRPWRSSDRLTVSVNEDQFPRRAVRSRSFNSATLNRLGDRTTFASSSTIPRSDANSLKDAVKNVGKEKKVKRDGKKWSKASIQLKGAFGKVFNPLKRSKSTADTPEPASATGNQDHEEPSEEDETRDKRFPKLRRVRLPRPESIVSEYNPDYPLFQYVFVVGVKEERSKTLSTYIIQQFPPQISKEDSNDPAIASVQLFCFPDLEHWKPSSSYKSETYSFVLTSMEGNKRFGYCRRLLPEGSGERLPEVYCIISPHGCFDLYSKVLDHVEQRRTVSRAEVFTLLKSLSANPFPAPGRTTSIRVISAKSGDMEDLKLTRPHESRLEHVNFGELCNTLSPKSIVQVFATLLMERRVILSAQRLSTLSSCCHALLALLYPFEWYHTCIPLLPNSLIDICSSPAPFIIGVSPRMVKQLDQLDVQMEETLIVDLDKGKFLKSFGDESTLLPYKLYKYLKCELESSDVQSVYKRASLSSKSCAVADDIVVNAFMTVFAYFYWKYTEFLVPDFQTHGQKFQKKEFVHSFASASEQKFLEEFHKTMMFDMFMHVREDPAKAESVCHGHFEKKLCKLKDRFPIIEQYGVKKSRFLVSKKAASSKS